MAVDRKADYVGTHDGKYIDIDGISRQFTYVDYDRNTTRLKYWNHSKREIILTPLEELIKKIIAENLQDSEGFIADFDGLGEKYGFERFRKGTLIRGEQMENTSDGWMEDLNKLYERHRL